MKINPDGSPSKKPKVVVLLAPTGSGKTHTAGEVVKYLYGQGERVAIAFDTLRLAQDFEEQLKKDLPEAFEAQAVAMCCGHNPIAKDPVAVAAGDDPNDEDDDGELDNKYPIYEWTRIVITTHSALSRRGFSGYHRSIWSKLEGFHIIVDEVSEFMARFEVNFDFGHRAIFRKRTDGNGGQEVPIFQCPKQGRFGNCSRCRWKPETGDGLFNRFGIREARSPYVMEVDRDGNRYRKYLNPIILDLPETSRSARRSGWEAHTGRSRF